MKSFQQILKKIEDTIPDNVHYIVFLIEESGSTMMISSLGEDAPVKIVLEESLKALNAENN